MGGRRRSMQHYGQRQLAQRIWQGRENWEMHDECNKYQPRQLQGGRARPHLVENHHMQCAETAVASAVAEIRSYKLKWRQWTNLHYWHFAFSWEKVNSMLSGGDWWWSWDEGNSMNVINSWRRQKIVISHCMHCICIALNASWRMKPSWETFRSTWNFGLDDSIDQVTWSPPAL